MDLPEAIPAPIPTPAPVPPSLQAPHVILPPTRSGRGVAVCSAIFHALYPSFIVQTLSIAHFIRLDTNIIYIQCKHYSL